MCTLSLPDVAALTAAANLTAVKFSAVKRSIGFAIGFHNHGEVPSVNLVTKMLMQNESVVVYKVDSG